MKFIFITALVVCISWFAGCSRSPSLPPGVSLHVKNGEVYLALDKDVAVSVYQNKAEDRRMVIVANHGDRLSIIQVENIGKTPRTLDLISSEQARFTVESGENTGPHTIIVDENGDGLPDLKMEGNKKYKGQVSWIEIPHPQ